MSRYIFDEGVPPPVVMLTATCGGPDFACTKKAKHLCGKCMVTKYCSKECQKEHWAKHKKTECKMFKRLNDMHPAVTGPILLDLVDEGKTDGMIAFFTFYKYYKDPTGFHGLASASSMDRNRDIALMGAAFKGHDDMAMYLIDAGADVNVFHGGRTALILAGEHGNMNIALALIAAGADLDAVTDHGCSALMWAAESGHADVAVMLIEKGANLDIREKKNGCTALMSASANGGVEIVDALLANGADATICDNRYGSNSLIIASQNGHADVATSLINSGLDVNYQNKDGWTALIWAAEKGHTKIVEELVKSGADLNLTETKYGSNALLNAAEKGHTEIAQILIDAGALLDVRDLQGFTPLLFSCGKGHIDVAVALIKGGCNPNIKHPDGISARYLAETLEHERVLELLNEADPSAAGTNILECREESDKIDFNAIYSTIASSLTNSGDGTNYKQDDGVTPLWGKPTGPSKLV